MKNANIVSGVLTVLAAVFLAHCSGDKEVSGPAPVPDYLPLATGYRWDFHEQWQSLHVESARPIDTGIGIDTVAARFGAFDWNLRIGRQMDIGEGIIAFELFDSGGDLKKICETQAEQLQREVPVLRRLGQPFLDKALVNTDTLYVRRTDSEVEVYRPHPDGTLILETWFKLPLRVGAVWVMLQEDVPGDRFQLPEIPSLGMMTYFGRVSGQGPVTLTSGTTFRNCYSIEHYGKFGYRFVDAANVWTIAREDAEVNYSQVFDLTPGLGWVRIDYLYTEDFYDLFDNGTELYTRKVYRIVDELTSYDLNP